MKNTNESKNKKSMKMEQIVSILSTAIPESDTWGGRESYGANSLVDNSKTVSKVLYCVTATQEVVQYFKKNGYDLLVSHHPFRVQTVPQLIYHTALDCCNGGLNDMWRDFLQMKDAKHFSKNLGWVGTIDPISFDDLVAKVEEWLGYKAIGKKYSDGKMVTSVVVCTGLGGLVYEEAAATGADCYITGELTSSDTHGFNAILETGHTISEFIGINLIRKLLPDIQVDAVPMELDYFSQEFHREYCFSSASLPSLSSSLSSSFSSKRVANSDIFDTLDYTLDGGNDFDFDFDDLNDPFYNLHSPDGKIKMLYPEERKVTPEEIIKWADGVVDSGEHEGPKPSKEPERDQLFWAVEILEETGKATFDF